MNEFGLRLRQIRKAKLLSLKELGEKSGCSPSYLSMVENGKANPSISRLKKIVDGLGITIVDLFQTQTTPDRIIRKHERLEGKFRGSKTEIEILVPNIPTRLIDARLAVIHPGGGTEGSYVHEGEEFGLILKGTFEITIDKVTYQLKEGDSFYFKSTETHSWVNRSRKDVILIWVNHPPTW